MSGIEIAKQYAQMAAVIGLIPLLAFWIKRILQAWGRWSE